MSSPDLVDSEECMNVDEEVVWRLLGTLYNAYIHLP